MKADSGRVASVPLRWIWKKCLGLMMAVVVLIMSMIAGLMISAIFFHGVEL
jgi:hypothetical protein